MRHDSNAKTAASGFKAHPYLLACVHSSHPRAFSSPLLSFVSYCCPLPHFIVPPFLPPSLVPRGGLNARFCEGQAVSFLPCDVVRWSFFLLSIRCCIVFIFGRRSYASLPLVLFHPLSGDSGGTRLGCRP